MNALAVSINGEETSVVDGTTVEQLVFERAGDGDNRSGRGVAVAVNGEVVPRSMWSETHLGSGDRVEILNAVGGG